MNIFNGQASRDRIFKREEEVKESDFRQENLAKQTFEDFTKKIVSEDQIYISKFFGIHRLRSAMETNSFTILPFC